MDHRLKYSLRWGGEVRFGEESGGRTAKLRSLSGPQGWLWLKIGGRISGVSQMEAGVRIQAVWFACGGRVARLGSGMLREKAGHLDEMAR